MESNSREPALEMNGKKRNGPSEEFSLLLKFYEVSDDRIVAGSLFHDASPATNA